MECFKFSGRQRSDHAASKDGTSESKVELNAVIVEVDAATGEAVSVQRLRIEGDE